MDVNIRLTIEPAAFFNVSLPVLLLDSNKITSRSSQTVPTDSLSLSLRLLALGEKNERRSRAVTTARITRAPADRKLPLIASQTFILHPEYPRLLSLSSPLSLSLSVCLSIKSLAIKLNRISLYHPSFVPTNTTYKSRRLFVMWNATGNLLGSNRVATIDISRYISTEQTYIVRGVDSSTRNDTWFLGGHASIPTRYFPFLSFETRSLRSLKRHERLLSFVKQFVSSVHREDTDCDDCRGEKGSAAQFREIVSVSLLLRRIHVAIS